MCIVCALVSRWCLMKSWRTCQTRFDKCRRYPSALISILSKRLKSSQSCSTGQWILLRLYFSPVLWHCHGWMLCFASFWILHCGIAVNWLWVFQVFGNTFTVIKIEKKSIPFKHPLHRKYSLSCNCWVKVYIGILAVLTKKTKKNTQTVCLFLLLLFVVVVLCVFISPDVILCGWLGLKHQLTN